MGAVEEFLTIMWEFFKDPVGGTLKMMGDAHRNVRDNIQLISTATGILLIYIYSYQLHHLVQFSNPRLFCSNLEASVPHDLFADCDLCIQAGERLLFWLA